MGKESNELTHAAMAITCGETSVDKDCSLRRRLIKTTTYALLGGTCVCVYILVRAEVVVSFTPL